MKVLFLGKRRYRARPDLEALLRVGADRGHQVSLIDRDQLLGQSLTDIDLVFAKSHYKDAAVRSHLYASGVHVVNDLAATARCESRLRIAACLSEANVPTPGFVALSHPATDFEGPCIAKPDLGGDHKLTLLPSPPKNPEPGVFYQQWLPASAVWKVYSIGGRHWAVKLSYSSTTALTDPKRGLATPAVKRLVDAAESVAAALGLTVFNSDFVDNDGLLYTIDVNPFPGLSAIPDAAEALWAVAEGWWETHGS